MKLIRDLALFKEEREEQTVVNNILEEEPDLNYQRQISFALQHIGIQNKLDSLVKAY